MQHIYMIINILIKLNNNNYVKNNKYIFIDNYHFIRKNVQLLLNILLQ